jgi:hypothetical protein
LASKLTNAVISQLSAGSNSSIPNFDGLVKSPSAALQLRRCGAPVSAPHSSVFALASGAFYETIVTPVKTGVQRIYNDLKRLDSGFRRNDGKPHFQTFYKIINFRTQKFAFLPFALSDPSHLFLCDRRFLIMPRC